MKRIVLFAALGCALALSACGTFFGGASTGATAPPAATGDAALNPAQKIVFQARAAYDAAVLVPLVNYAQLPACGSAGATSICSKPDVVAKLTAADKVVASAFDAAESIAARSPNTDPATLLADVNDAASVAEALITTYDIR